MLKKVRHKPGFKRERKKEKLVHVIRHYTNPDMVEVSKDVFDTEEEAQQFAYDNYSSGYLFSYEVEKEIDR